MRAAEAESTLEDARPIFRLGVDRYHQMIDAGIFDEDDRVELIDGELRAVPPIKPDHAGKNKRLNRLLTLRAGEDAVVSVQDPLTLAPHSEPEPDLMLLRPSRQRALAALRGFASRYPELARHLERNQAIETVEALTILNDYRSTTYHHRSTTSRLPHSRARLRSLPM